ncbi:hypothetical protein N6L27_09875 [Leisingera sp. SS27]|nr:hypothetical protein [Leisingera sp. SS27]
MANPASGILLTGGPAGHWMAACTLANCNRTGGGKDAPQPDFRKE